MGKLRNRIGLLTGNQTEIMMASQDLVAAIHRSAFCLIEYVKAKKENAELEDIKNNYIGSKNDATSEHFIKLEKNMKENKRFQSDLALKDKIYSEMYVFYDFGDLIIAADSDKLKKDKLKATKVDNDDDEEEDDEEVYLNSILNEKYFPKIKSDHKILVEKKLEFDGTKILDDDSENELDKFLNNNRNRDLNGNMELIRKLYFAFKASD